MLNYISFTDKKWIRWRKANEMFNANNAQTTSINVTLKDEINMKRSLYDKIGYWLMNAQMWMQQWAVYCHNCCDRMWANQCRFIFNIETQYSYSRLNW